LNKVAKMESLTADVLWLAIKVQHKLGDKDAEAGWATQLRRHHAVRPNMLLINVGRLMSETGVPMNLSGQNRRRSRATLARLRPGIAGRPARSDGLDG
jgi:hypothetical protein